MPGKTAKSAPLAPFELLGMTALVRAATLSCENAGKSQKCTQDRESSGESRFRSAVRQRFIFWTTHWERGRKADKGRELPGGKYRPRDPGEALDAALAAITIVLAVLSRRRCNECSHFHRLR